ncbi:ATP-dependent endonuclease [Halomonas sp. SL1]|uniref:ATP-dependent nuclease n=1 Tax=Halomonas sp. SL1 TaxID=2137478 RepID=UPI000D1542E9|nr:AAA family ATPase [Halomonas sp. SL1]RAH37489.1 DUF2813 domain-containing protein [Halomonas sp. SL1]
MKASYIEIRKFRSIDFCKIPLDSINAVVGQNNSGKSAVIRALNCFFNVFEEELSFSQGKHNYSPSSIPKITVGFENIDEDSAAWRHTDNGRADIQLVFHPSSKKLQYKKKVGGKFVNISIGDVGDILENFAFVYIPPNRSPSQLKWQEDALIKELVEEFLKIETSRRDTLTPRFKGASDYLESGALKKISREVGRFYSLRKELDFSLSFDKKANFLSFLTDIHMYVNEYGVESTLDDCGTGLQSLTIIAFHRVLAKIRHKRVILGIEEPETNLHPQAQRELINSIKNAPDDNVAQVVITTHSTVIIDNIDHRKICLVRKTEDRVRGFKSIVAKTSESFFDDHGLEEFKYYQFHSYKNSDFFYANYVVFVESKNEAEVVKHLSLRNGVDLDLQGVSVVNIGGVNNLAYPYHIVKDLGIPFLIILDKDFFIPYLNDDLQQSRNNEGLPKYRYEYKAKSIRILESIIPAQKDRDKILSTMRVNHSKANEEFLKHNVICMNYSLEMDLLCSNKAVELYSDVLGLRGEQRSRGFLLTNRNNTVKKIGNILKVLDQLENRNLPNSYKSIKRKLGEISSFS